MTLGIYIQVPFCQTKCTYCNFHTGVVSRERYQPYANAVCREISGVAEVRQPPADTVYFGGGTPSLLDSAALAKILDTLRATYSLETPEITLEADPETITPEKAKSWLAAGFNRLSLGVQSFNDRELQATGRMHRRADVARTTETLRAAGFDNICMDLIIGLPHQTRESWELSVNELLALRPEHISIYMLEVDEGSHLGKESLAGGTRYSAPAIPPDDTQAEFYDSACDASRDSRLRSLRDIQLGAPRPPLAPQSQVLAARTLLGLRRRRALLRRKNALGQRPRLREVCRHDRAGNHPTRANRASHTGASPRRRILPRPTPARRHRPGPYRTRLLLARRERARPLRRNPAPSRVSPSAKSPRSGRRATAPLPETSHDLEFHPR